MALDPIFSLFDRGGVIIWIIAGLSVLTLAVILWKCLDLMRIGAWGGHRVDAAVEAWCAHGESPDAIGGGVRMRVVCHAAQSIQTLPDAAAREEVERVARRELGKARQGLRLLEVISTVAPLLGLLGTVLGMIAAFQALQGAGRQADPSVLAGGIWEALLTTAAGMAVAIPAALALAWFDGVVDRAAADIEDLVTRMFVRGRGAETRGAK